MTYAHAIALAIRTALRADSRGPALDELLALLEALPSVRLHQDPRLPVVLYVAWSPHTGVILAPADAPARALAHELAHHLRGDGLAGVLQQQALAAPDSVRLARLARRVSAQEESGARAVVLALYPPSEE